MKYTLKNTAGIIRQSSFFTIQRTILFKSYQAYFFCDPFFNNIAIGKRVGKRKQKGYSSPRFPKQSLIISNEYTAQSLVQVLRQIRCVLEISKDPRGKILFLTSNPILSGLVEKVARSLCQNYINDRWIPGLLTNFPKFVSYNHKIHHSLDKKMLRTITGQVKQQYLSGYSSFTKRFRGLRHFRSLPLLVVVVDAYDNSKAIYEANKRNVPVILLTDLRKTSKDTFNTTKGSHHMKEGHKFKYLNYLAYCNSNSVHFIYKFLDLVIKFCKPIIKRD